MPLMMGLVLPVEVISSVLSVLSRVELLPCLTVSVKFNHLASRALYHTIEDLSPSRSIACLRTLSHAPQLRTLVRQLILDWSDLSLPLGAAYRLLYTVLKKGLPYLITLNLEFPRIEETPGWILDGCRSELKHLSINLPCDGRLAKFLDRQPSLVELTLRGSHNAAASNIPPFIINGYSPTPTPSADHSSTTPAPYVEGIPVEKDQHGFALRDTSLPKLNSLRTLRCGPSTIASVVKGRPIEFASIAMSPYMSSESLQALSLSSTPLRRLSVMSFDASMQDDLLKEIANRFPELEALHIIIILSEYTNELLKALGPLLSSFKVLQYVTFIAPTDQAALPGEEHDIAKLWHSWCPTLKTIILPQGRVWFEGRADWSSLEE